MITIKYIVTGSVEIQLSLEVPSHGLASFRPKHIGLGMFAGLYNFSPNNPVEIFECLQSIHDKAVSLW